MAAIAASRSEAEAYRHAAEAAWKENTRLKKGASSKVTAAPNVDPLITPVLQ
jgi:hypothetical protein